MTVMEEINNALKEQEAENKKTPIHIGNDFYEFHTFKAGNPIMVNISTVMIVGVVDRATTLTFNVQENIGPCVIEVRESYEAIKSILSRRYM